MIGIDWGTSSFRAFRMDGDGIVLDRLAASDGIMKVENGDFSGTLQQLVGPWLADGETDILMSGMIGSRQGWQEAPYLPCPASLPALAAALMAVPFAGARLRIVPGLCITHASGDFDVMRGEETQIFGLTRSQGFSGLVILPGSHSKMAQVEDGRVTRFTSFMTGEVFAALRHHTILGRLMAGEPAVDEAFRAGVQRSAQDDSFLHRIFMARTGVLSGAMAETETASFLSGLVIGEELAGHVSGKAVHLIGTASLCTLYAEAIRLLGGTIGSISEDAAAAGLFRLSRAA